MSDAKLMAMYSLPKNVDAFEKIYPNERVPLAVAKLGGKTLTGQRGDRAHRQDLFRWGPIFLVPGEETIMSTETVNA
jgi:hypothetical protein